MTITIDQTSVAANNDPANPNAPIWLYELRIAGRDVVYLAANPTDITITGGETYLASNVVLSSDISHDNEGRFPRASLTIDNVSKQLLSIIERERGFVDQTVVIKYVWSHNTTNTPIEMLTTRVVEADATRVAVTFTLGPRRVFEARFPARNYQASCAFQYRSVDCGFPVVASYPAGLAAQPFIDTCDHSYDGVNGCKRKGEAYAAIGQTSLWPKRFGGFRTIPKRRGP